MIFRLMMLSFVCAFVLLFLQKLDAGDSALSFVRISPHTDVCLARFGHPFSVSNRSGRSSRSPPLSSESSPRLHLIVSLAACGSGVDMPLATLLVADQVTITLPLPPSPSGGSLVPIVA